jgi:hypothetical protein
MRRPRPLPPRTEDYIEDIEGGALLYERSLFVIGFYLGLGFICAQVLFGFVALILFVLLVAR